MAKIIKYGLVPITVFTLCFFALYKLTAKCWVYDLPNDYKIRKTSNDNVTLGVEINHDFYTTYQEKTVGIDEYVAEFQYNDQFVGVKALKIVDKNANVIFYLVNTKEQEVYGPYNDEESYLAATGVWAEEPMNDWMTTTEVPEGAYFK